MALAKVYDSEDTLMVPIDLEDAERFIRALNSGAQALENANVSQSTSDDLRNLSDAIADALTAAGL